MADTRSHSVAATKKGGGIVDTTALSGTTCCGS